jgi:DNA repair protein RadA/Sms
LSEVGDQEAARSPSGIGEFDRVLGGGLVGGSVVLLGGDPGIGKSTLLLQVCGEIGASDSAVLYVTGEESLAQIAMRAGRLGIDTDSIQALAETSVEHVIAAADRERPACLVVDSIQTMSSESLPAAPGAVSQLRECTAQLVRFAKASGTSVLLVGHVTKDGQIAGPRVLEHMVDVVLYFESEAGSRYRVLRTVKNRFGAANELGIFAMTGSGIRPVTNPSAIFLSQHPSPVPGSAVTAIFQGSRPLLVEVQALADRSGGGARRVAVGMDQNRLALLLAILHRHVGLSIHDVDVFVNVVGGVRITETAADLAAVAAVVSSLADIAIPADTLVLGELGLSGEIRPVAYGVERVAEASSRAFKRVIVPRANMPRKAPPGVEIVAVEYLPAALEALSLAP